jgi:hypothetical protein
MHTGGCFCGAVRFTVDGTLTGVTYCHCSKCRRWHGHAGAYTAADRAGFHVTESRGLAWHIVSPTVRRAFCSVCGSSLLFDDSTDPKMGICAGSIDQPTGLRENAHIFVASKGDYYEVPAGLPAWDTIPVRAKAP